MRFIHRISARLSDEQLRTLDGLGLELERQPPPGLYSFDVAEDHANWGRLECLFREWRAVDILTTVFSSVEVDSASWLRLVPEWHWDYPRPRPGSFGYLEATYDLSTYCRACGCGSKQKAPLQMKGEPRWGRREMLQLNWVFDEFFVTPRAYERVFKPWGVESCPVLGPKGRVLTTVVQLVVREHVSIETPALTGHRCGACGLVKYEPHTRGPLPPISVPSGAGVAKTHEFFGAGRDASQQYIVSQAIGREMKVNGIRGASLWPVETNRRGAGAG